MSPTYQKPVNRFYPSVFTFVLALLLTLPMYLTAQTTCTANAGRLVAQESCTQDDAVNLKATSAGDTVVPSGYRVLYVLTGGDSLTILQVNARPAFTVNNPAGLYTIHTLVYDPATLDLSIVVPRQTTGFAVNRLLVQGGGNICAALDVTGSRFRFGGCDNNCAAKAGSLRADSLVCLRERDSVRLTASIVSRPAVPTGYRVLYVLTSGQNLVIEQVNTRPSFFVNRTGRFTIHTLVYDPTTLDLSIVVPGTTTGVEVNNLLIQGGGRICAALDVAGAPINVTACPAPPCTANAGTLAATPGACLRDSVATLTAARRTPAVVPAGFQLIYVLTSGRNLVIEQVNTQPTFRVRRTGRFTIHTLVYNPATLDLSIVVPGTTTGVDVNNLLIQGGGGICAALDVAGAPFDVAACPPAVCTANAGTLRNSGETHTCLLANNGVTLTATRRTPAVVPAGYQLIYVLTSGNGLVIEQVGAQPSFTVRRTGRYTIHTLVYDPNTLNLNTVVLGRTTGFDVNRLLIQGGGTICASLDVAGAKYDVVDCRCAADAGKLGYTRSSNGSNVTLFNGKAFLAATTIQAPVVPRGYQKIYVLTSGENLVIEQVSQVPVFVVNRTGTFRIHTLIYDPNTLNLNTVVPGRTTGVEVNRLLIQGGGSICAALDVAGLRFQVRNSGAARAMTYPNPAMDFVNIELLQLENIARINIEVLDVNGNLVKQLQLDGNTELANLDIASLRNGVYFVKIRYDEQFEQQLSITKMK
jgi:hypothetical protein